MRPERKELKNEIRKQREFIERMKVNPSTTDAGCYAIAEAIGRLTLLSILDR